MPTIIHALLGYLLLLLVVRVFARRPGAQMTLFEFVIIFLLGGIVILATVGKDRSVTNCGSAIITVGLMHRLMSWLKFRSPRLGRLVDGTPLLLFKEGEWQHEAMMHMAPEDVLASARGKGLKSLDEVKYAVLERNGGISIFEAEH
jgi:uncharacterized membrane protein YcaP (DUF421 family)